jgi:hypothetical protein
MDERELLLLKAVRHSHALNWPIPNGYESDIRELVKQGLIEILGKDDKGNTDCRLTAAGIHLLNTL